MCTHMGSFHAPGQSYIRETRSCVTYHWYVLPLFIPPAIEPILIYCLIYLVPHWSVMCRVMVLQCCSKNYVTLQFHELQLSGSGDRLTSRSDNLIFSILSNPAGSRASHLTREIQSVVEFEIATQHSLWTPDLFQFLSPRFKTKKSIADFWCIIKSAF